MAHRPSCSMVCGIFPDQGSNPCPLHWQADSQPLCHKGSPNTVFSGEMLAAFSSKPMTKQACPPSPVLFNIFLELSASAIRLEREHKTIKVGGEGVVVLLSLLLFICVENLSRPTEKPLQAITQFSKVPDAKLIYRNHNLFIN